MKHIKINFGGCSHAKATNLAHDVVFACQINLLNKEIQVERVHRGEMNYGGIDEGGGSTMVDSPGGTLTVTHLLFRQIWKERREMRSFIAHER
jgi:hypothetical protein